MNMIPGLPYVLKNSNFLIRDFYNLSNFVGLLVKIPFEHVVIIKNFDY